MLVVVVDGELLGLDAELIASVGLGAGVTSHCQIRGVTVFHDVDAGLLRLKESEIFKRARAR